MTSQEKVGVIILAAGLGKRMHSKVPKALQEVAGKPFLFHLLLQIQKSLGDVSIAIVVGHCREEVESFVKNEKTFSKMKIHFVIQPQPLGTGNAARCAMDSTWGEAQIQAKSLVLILPGDIPLISSDLIEEMSYSLKNRCVLRLLSCLMDVPTGYGRVIRRPKKGPVIEIVEEKDATEKQRLIHEVATSIYLFESRFLKEGLSRLSNNNVQGEYYLTDLVRFASKTKKKIESVIWKEPDDLRGVNDLWELAQVDRIMNERLLRHWAQKGVRLIHPETIRLEMSVELSEGVTIFPGVILRGRTCVGSGSTIGPQVMLKDVVIGKEVQVKAGTIAEQSEVGDYSQVGPYAHLRPDSKVGCYVKIGNFVELKKATIGNHTSIAHLSYLGDAQVGERVNVGCGFITCNFDGRVVGGNRKHKTIIEDDVFLGSDCQAIAPITIGKGSYVASGSTLTESVEADGFAIARTRQVTKKNYARKLKSV